MTRDEVLSALRRDNPKARPDDVVLYADAYLSYREASANIDKNGVIVAHPRTGAPIENPYLKVRSSAMASLQKLARVKNVSSLWG